MFTNSTIYPVVDFAHRRSVQFGDSQHRAFGRRNSRTTCDISLMDRLNEAAKQIRTLPLEANLWQTQNICYKILHTNW
jgi:hypothetical protein